MFNTADNEVMYLSIVTRITSKKIRVISTGVETIGTLRSDDEDDYEHEFSVLSTRTSKNVGLRTSYECSVRKTRTRSRSRRMI